MIDVEHKFDKGVPVPVRIGSNPLKSMKVGESFTFPKNERNSYQSNASRVKRETGKEYTIRLTDADECRIWRIK